ncbi:MAG: hypothetical protein U5K69_15325 [Balneolaceae bacterium]|nr:hypothetical protein [Balneolaceae bacterium]
MFVGHFGLGLAAKKSAPAVSLGTLLLAAQFVDLLWPTFLLLGWERVAIEPGITTVTPLNFTHYPISHSLLASIGWGFLLGAIYYAIKRNTKASVIIGMLVVSHWFLDVIVHRPDLPIFPGGATLVGFGLWNSLGGTLVVESLLFFGDYIFTCALQLRKMLLAGMDLRALSCS